MNTAIRVGRFRLRPSYSDIQAVQYTGAFKDVLDVFHDLPYQFTTKQTPEINTSAGPRKLMLDNWVIRYPSGQYTVLSTYMLESMYHPVPEVTFKEAEEK